MKTIDFTAENLIRENNSSSRKLTLLLIVLSCDFFYSKYLRQQFFHNTDQSVLKIMEIQMLTYNLCKSRAYNLRASN